MFYKILRRFRIPNGLKIQNFSCEETSHQFVNGIIKILERVAVILGIITEQYSRVSITIQHNNRSKFLDFFLRSLKSFANGFIDTFWIVLEWIIDWKSMHYVELFESTNDSVLIIINLKWMEVCKSNEIWKQI